MPVVAAIRCAEIINIDKLILNMYLR